jgi:methionyl-tRNA synthetase
MTKRFYITTAIDYVNGLPHLGHAYEKIVADAIARAHRSLGDSTFYLTGLDEHGQKVQQAAVALGEPPQTYCDRLAGIWQPLTTQLNLSNDDFIRTTQTRHKDVVRGFLDKLHKKGDLYKAQYTGLYSARQETFLTEKDRLPNGTFDPIYGEVVQLVEDNWYFRMSRYQDWLIAHIEANPDFVRPDYRRNEVLGFLRAQLLEDLCISRPLARLTWGIPLPFDPEFVTYVWFDALTNYLSVPASLGDPGAAGPLAGFYTPPAPGSELPPALWPADIHLVGKDILKFHAVFWPIMLHAGDIPVPRQILVHGWWQKNGEKMSKSTGNVVDPLALTNDWGVDAFRYYVLRELDIGPDGNWTDEGFQARYHAELANGLGNLVNRSLSMLKRYRQGRVPNPNAELAPEASALTARVIAELRNHRLQSALVATWELVTRANQYVDQTAPFKLAKDPAQAARLDAVLYNLVEVCRILAVLLWPFLPDTALKINAQLGLNTTPDTLRTLEWGVLPAGHTIADPIPLFPRRDQPAKH